MNKIYIEEQKFEKIDFSKNPLIPGDYEKCNFINCNFPGTDLSDLVFLECEFKNCDLSMARLTKTAIRDCKFFDCKLLGVHFENCNEFLFSVFFENCILNLASFYKLNLKKTRFIKSGLHETDFANTNLTGSVFDQCDLRGAVFDNTILEKADFRTAYNYTIDPERNRIKKARFSITGIAGLLNKYDIEID